MTAMKERNCTGFLLTATLGCLLVCGGARAQTQMETLTGTVVPGNDEDYCLLLFAANNVVTAQYLPVEQEAGDSTFSVPVAVPVAGSITEVATILSVYGGNGGVNDSPLAAVVNATTASAATATAAANGMNGPETFSSTFSGADEVTLFSDLEKGDSPSLNALQTFFTGNASQFVTLTNGYGAGDVEAFSQINPGAATFELEVPEPGSGWLLLGGAAVLVVIARGKIGVAAPSKNR